MIKFFTGLKKKHQILFALIVSIAVVSVWRGIWGLMDYFLFPQNIILSYIVSIIIGILVLLLTGLIVEELT